MLPTGMRQLRIGFFEKFASFPEEGKKLLLQ